MQLTLSFESIPKQIRLKVHKYHARIRPPRVAPEGPHDSRALPRVILPMHMFERLAQQKKNSRANKSENITSKYLYRPVMEAP